MQAKLSASIVCRNSFFGIRVPNVKVFMKSQSNLKRRLCSDAYWSMTPSCLNCISLRMAINARPRSGQESCLKTRVRSPRILKYRYSTLEVKEILYFKEALIWSLEVYSPQHRKNCINWKI